MGRVVCDVDLVGEGAAESVIVQELGRDDGVGRDWGL